VQKKQGNHKDGEARRADFEDEYHVTGEADQADGQPLQHEQQRLGSRQLKARNGAADASARQDWYMQQTRGLPGAAVATAYKAVVRKINGTQNAALLS